MENNIQEYPLTHQIGVLSIELDTGPKIIYGHVGVQISIDGRIWICIDGKSILRFKPLSENMMKIISNNK